MKNIINLKIIYIFVLCIILFYGCSGIQIYSEAFIKQTADWKMIKQPGYEGPSTDVDFLIGEDIKIRVEAFNGILKDDVFTINLMFDSKKNIYQFNPSRSFVKLSNNKTIDAKGLLCPYTFHDLDFFRKASPIEEAVPVDKKLIRDSETLYKCFILFFDTQPPSVEEEFVLILNGLTKSGQPVSIPEIFFRKATR